MPKDAGPIPEDWKRLQEEQEKREAEEREREEKEEKELKDMLEEERKLYQERLEQQRRIQEQVVQQQLAARAEEQRLLEQRRQAEMVGFPAGEAAPPVSVSRSHAALREGRRGRTCLSSGSPIWRVQLSAA